MLPGQAITGAQRVPAASQLASMLPRLLCRPACALEEFSEQASCCSGASPYVEDLAYLPLRVGLRADDEQPVQQVNGDAVRRPAASSDIVHSMPSL
jgi:hypothetical protein